ncbi:hypothetical protein VPH35_106182 [Triticum aestivum]
MAEQARADFATKLSLRKFMATAQRVTLDQRQLARSMGLDHLLDLKCDTLPRGVVHYLASNFDVPSRAIELPNGFKFTITPYCIHQVLGIPLGGRTIEKKQNPALRSLIAQQTKCKGNYPTINELDNLIQPRLDGDSFKRIFTMYALTVLLCPSSHGAASPDYYHILEDPEQIGSFDFCTAVLDKLVASIDSYKAGATTVLAGDLLTLTIIYFEFLDTDIMPVTSKRPRISLWTSEIVAEYERRDCTSSDKLLYGRLPTKRVSETPFGQINRQPKVTLGASYDELLQFTLSIVPEENHQMVLDKLPKIMHSMQSELFDSMQNVLAKNFMNLLKLMSSMHSSSPSKKQNSTDKDSSCVPISEAPTVPCGSHSSLQMTNMPRCTEALEGMYPQKVQVGDTEAEPTHTFSLLSYVLDEKAFWHRPLSPREPDLLTCRELNLFEEWKVSTKVDGSEGPTSSDPIRTTEDITNRNKRTTCMSLNETADNCVALKKRARMFQNTDELSSNIHHEMPHTLGTVSASSHEKDQSSSDANLGQIQQTPVHGTSSATNKDFPWDDPDMVAQLIESTDRIEEEWFSQQRQTQYTTSVTQDIHISEIKPNEICCNFTSNPVESAVFSDIVSRIPPHSRQKSPRIVQMGSTWVEHRVFGLSMQVYGRVNKYVINMLGKAVMAEQTEKDRLNLLPRSYWSRYYVECDTAVFLPLSSYSFWYTVVANFRKKLFEVLCPNNRIDLIADEAQLVIKNFKAAFKLAYKRSQLNVTDMGVSFRSVCSSTKEADSGIFTMKLVQGHDGDNTLCFEPEHAKSLRESLTYYMVAHPCNEKTDARNQRNLKKISWFARPRTRHHLFLSIGRLASEAKLPAMSISASFVLLK